MVSKYELAVNVKAAPGFLGTLGRVAFSMSILSFMSGLHNIAMLREAQTLNRLTDLQIRHSEILEDRAKIEQAYADATANVQILEGRRATLQEGITQAVEAGTGSAFQYQMAQVMLIQTEKDLEKARKDQQKALEDRIQNERQLEKLGRQIELQNKAVALAQEQVAQTSFTQQLAMAQVAFTAVQSILAFNKLVGVYGLLRGSIGSLIIAHRFAASQKIIMNALTADEIVLTNAATVSQGRYATALMFTTRVLLPVVAALGLYLYYQQQVAEFEKERQEFEAAGMAPSFARERAAARTATRMEEVALFGQPKELDPLRRFNLGIAIEQFRSKESTTGFATHEAIEPTLLETLFGTPKENIVTHERSRAEIIQLLEDAGFNREEILAVLEEKGLQLGGLVTRPTRTVVGEAGPEAVIPLASLQSQFQSQQESTINAIKNITEPILIASRNISRSIEERPVEKIDREALAKEINEPIIESIQRQTLLSPEDITIPLIEAMEPVPTAGQINRPIVEAFREKELTSIFNPNIMPAEPSVTVTPIQPAEPIVNVAPAVIERERKIKELAAARQRLEVEVKKDTGEIELQRRQFDMLSQQLGRSPAINIQPSPAINIQPSPAVITQAPIITQPSPIITQAQAPINISQTPSVAPINLIQAPVNITQARVPEFSSITVRDREIKQVSDKRLERELRQFSDRETSRETIRPIISPGATVSTSQIMRERTIRETQPIILEAPIPSVKTSQIIRERDLIPVPSTTILREKELKSLMTIREDMEPINFPLIIPPQEGMLPSRPQIISPNINVTVHVAGAMIGGSEAELAERVSEIVNRNFDRHVRSIT